MAIFNSKLLVYQRVPHMGLPQSSDIQNTITDTTGSTFISA